MRLLIKVILVLFLLLFIEAYVFAQSPQNQTLVFPGLEPDPKALEFFRLGTEDGGYSWIDLAKLSLWASGDTEAPRLEQILSLADAVKNAEGYPTEGKGRAEFILGYMHKNLLRSYALTQSGIDTLLTSGRYNCVSSAVLYMLLCKSSGLEVSGVMTKDHALVTIHLDGEDIDVETTNLYGFDPGNRKEFHDQFGKLTGFVYVPARNYRDRQTITSIELVSLIISNRISEHEARNRFSEAVSLAVNRAAMLSGAELTAREGAGAFFVDPRQDLMNKLFNYGASLLNSGREEDSLRWAAYAALRYPDENRWQEFVLAAVNNRVTKYTRSNNLAEARNFLETKKSVLSSANYAQLDSVLIDTELLSGAKRVRGADDGNSIIAAINEARANGRLAGKRADELYTFTVQKTASILSAAPGRDWLSAIDYIESVIAVFGSNRELEQSLRTYKNNRAADFHNRFGAALNKKHFDEAERILNEALAEFPADSRLLADREILNKNRP